MIADGGKRGCLGDESVLRFLHRELLPTEDARVHAHIAACANCRRIVAEASRMFFEDEGEAAPPRARADRAFPEKPLEASDEGDWPARILPPGTHVSRYVVRRLIGAGAGGTVYEAHDPQLGRPVALKLVRQPPDQRVRRVPEEQALAKLSHPNVVNVYDTGVFESQTFVVMELVVGTSARDWLEEQPRSWREVVQVFLEAGRGLAASHAVGLVHRDFKPENVIVGTDGRARVTDFGLARALIRRALPEEEPAASTSGGAAELGASSIAGTPAYMAPEQFRGRRADERSDQFSFCVSLYRALYRQPPFSKRAERTDPAVFAREVLSGRVRPPPPDTAVPVWLDRLIRRGLRTNPAERFPSMEALLSEIRGRDRAQRSVGPADPVTAPPHPAAAGGNGDRAARDRRLPIGRRQGDRRGQQPLRQRSGRTGRGVRRRQPGHRRRVPARLSERNLRRRRPTPGSRGMRRRQPGRGRRLQLALPALHGGRRPVDVGRERPLLHPARPASLLATGRGGLPGHRGSPGHIQRVRGAPGRARPSVAGPLD